MWALPTIRALARRRDTTIDLITPGEFEGIHPLLAQQSYIGKVQALDGWGAADPRPPLDDTQGYWSSTYDLILHLGYPGWPERGLPFEVLESLNRQSDIPGSKWTKVGQYLSMDLDLQTPWIRIDGRGDRVDIFVGFTEAWFELKLGLMMTMARRELANFMIQYTPSDSRWVTEVEPVTVPVVGTNDWCRLARTMRNADLFFGDCSALHVLAVSMGIPAVVCEPMEARHNPIFWPLGMNGPQVTCVKGHDAKPTFDARACAEAIQAALSKGATRHGKR